MAEIVRLGSELDIVGFGLIGLGLGLVVLLFGEVCVWMDGKRPVADTGRWLLELVLLDLSANRTFG